VRGFVFVLKQLRLLFRSELARGSVLFRTHRRHVRVKPLHRFDFSVARAARSFPVGEV
jgi:hypothetical protein